MKPILRNPVAVTRSDPAPDRPAREASPSRQDRWLSLTVFFPVLALTMAASAAEGTPRVDPFTLSGKLMCGYQGWFNAEGDGADLGWVHWARNPRQAFAPGNITVDLWPDVSELGPEERFETGFRHADGRVAEVFSSYKEATVVRHFRWMRDYGIDGVFLQRFIGAIQNPGKLHHNNAVLAHCRKGAAENGRVFALMYDLSSSVNHVAAVKDDWRRLRADTALTEDAAYLHHRGKPLVAVWGVGFRDDRPYTVADCLDLVEFLKNDGCSIMLGVPTFWRELRRDALSDPALHEVLALADVISPWTVGRYRTPGDAVRHANTVVAGDMEWCGGRGIDYLPVIFPGFSWFNLKGGSINQIPRLKGEFFWSQFAAVRRAGAGMVYVAMFDEVDEGTAIFKCVNDPPVAGGVNFVTYEGLPSDAYLRLAGAAAAVLRGEAELSGQTPKVNP